MYLYSVIRGIVGILFRLLYRLEVHGKDNVLEEGRLILCSNHISNLDPIILSIVFPRQVCWMAKKQLFKNKVLSCFLTKLGAFPVDREESDLSAIRNALKVLKKESVLGIFPEGTRVKEMNIENAKSGVALISIKANSPVLPVYIEGHFKPFSKIRVYFGKPISFFSKDDKKLTTEDYRLFSKEILQSIYSIKDKEVEM